MPKKPSKKIANEYWSYPITSKALEIALYYGFSPSDPVSVEKSDREHSKTFVSEDVSRIKPEEKAALLRHWFGKCSSQMPLSLAAVHDEHQHGRLVEFSLDTLGTSRSIADATLLKAAYEIVRTQGYAEATLELNSIGDRESFARFSRELGAYYRKHMSELHAECRQIIKKNLFAPLTCSHDACKAIKERVPHPMNFLSEPSRAYFSELLELLEMSEIPYTINNDLLANRECALHTIFRILGSDGTKTDTIAYGCRWGLIAKKMGFKKDIQGMSATILIEKPERRTHSIRIKKPQCYFIQMGQEAKLKSLRIIETLRLSHIPVYHSLTKDKMTAQLSSAESLKVPYILIMGQKESLENTVLIREMCSRSQETIKVEHIGRYLKKVFG